MSAPELLTVCPGCGAELPDRPGGPTHRHLESTPACWAVYGEVLAREYGDREYYRMHKLTVDAYAVQHPGQPSPQTIQSVGAHLVRLCLMLERGCDPDRATAIMQKKVAGKGLFRWLEPPFSRGQITVADVHGARDAEEHQRLVQAWAECAWGAWSSYHETVRGWI